MGYSEMELRSKHNSLLRRIQRQLDKKIKLKEVSDKKSKKIKLKEFLDKKKLGGYLVGLDKGLEDLDEDYEILSKVRKTKLSLYNKRGNSKW